ncbi:MAG: RNA methyltransferase [Muribaculaceae bacterium]|nr:RNA methyltransferase [Muribaculaceae bacterium]
MPIIEIGNLDDGEVRIYSNLTDHELKRYKDNKGLFIAESPKVILTALEEGYSPKSLLCERRHINGDAASIISRFPDMPVYTGPRELLARLTGYTLTRGVLCAMYRKEEVSPAEICENGSRVAVIEAVCDTTNIGSIFRAAAALGIDGILLTPDSCDPLNRRAIRVSMGSVFKIPWAFVEKPVQTLKKHGFVTVALTLHKDSIPINSKVLMNNEKLAFVLGTEGTGLSESIISECDFKAIIPMMNGVDSLNVASAASIVFWEATKNCANIY